MSVIDEIRAKAMTDVRRIVLPEGSEPRTVQAARSITDLKIAKVTLLGDETEIQKTAEQTETDLTGVAVIDPKTSEKLGGIYGFTIRPSQTKGHDDGTSRGACIGEYALLRGADGKGERRGRHGSGRD